jgi:hypothetical protein|nr:hypothetical protein [Prevotella sp.]DAG71749.1 MAG TPA: YvrJ protein family protein [Caudoviricetes sp.]DAI85351.1 MAG TPA: YvrJ protein family protein [Caudoviricetes sp.]
METAQMVITAISTVGFPIVMCGALFWKMDKQDKEHKEEMNKSTEAINNNTVVLQKLMQMLSDKIEFDTSNSKEK